MVEEILLFLQLLQLEQYQLWLRLPLELNQSSQYLIKEGEKSKDIRKRVNDSRDIQLQRFKNEKIFSNSQMNPKQIRKYCQLKADSKDILKRAMDKMGLSARAYDRILKVSRTIADLEGSENIEVNHISEAVQYRSLDRKFWEWIFNNEQKRTKAKKYGT